ncbi:DUF559 domain-containing protein [Arthrobacter sp. LAPM80]|uniref:DUF559 domain-containing protein n=1 Tax=Arthrobacter sp. LAPM80 TaxID=3141788 RepID=UPI00398AAE34
MKPPEPLPLILAQRPFTLKQARSLGLSEKRARPPTHVTPSREIRMPRLAHSDLLERCRAHVDVTPNSIVSHLTAAALHGLTLPSRFDVLPVIDLSRRFGKPQPRRKHVRGHNLDLAPEDVVVRGGVALTSVQRTLVDVAPWLTLDELVVVVDQIVCAHDGTCVPFRLPIVGLDALQEYVVRHSGRRGMRRLKEAMVLARVGVDSPPETRLRLIIARSPLPEFEPNLKIMDDAGRPLVQPDLSCEEYRTCIEYDGNHHFTAEQQVKDHDRDYLTKSLGWHQVLINKEGMRQGAPAVVSKIARMLKLAGWPDRHNLAGGSLADEFRGRRHIR